MQPFSQINTAYNNNNFNTYNNNNNVNNASSLTRTNFNTCDPAREAKLASWSSLDEKKEIALREPSKYLYALQQKVDSFESMLKFSFFNFV